MKRFSQKGCLSGGLPALILGAVLLHQSSIALVQAQEAEEIPEPYKTLMKEGPAQAGRFSEVPVSIKAGEAKWFEVAIDKNLLKVKGDHEFALIRFTAPTEPGLDMVWSFATPPEWGNWYILPVEGRMEGFQQWFDADRLYEQLKTDRSNPPRLQTLPAARLKPGASYLLWFKAPPVGERSGKTPDLRLRGAISFLPPARDEKGAEAEWDNETIEKALGLKASPVAEQVGWFDSRGGKILLDARFFEAGYAENRINDLLFTVRQHKTTSDGGFVGIRISIPPCRTEPRIKDILTAHGQPDLVLTPADRKALQPQEEKKDADVTVYYFDHFGFEVRGKEGNPKVRQVTAEASSAALLRPTMDGFTWADAPPMIGQLRLFYQDKKEIARVAFWGREEARLLSGNLPKQTFLTKYEDGAKAEELIHEGDGNWQSRSYYHDGKLFREAGFKNFLYHGKLQDFHPDGKPKTLVEYKNGQIDGELKQWDEKGKVRLRRFKAGKPVD